MLWTLARTACLPDTRTRVTPGLRGACCPCHTLCGQSPFENSFSRQRLGGSARKQPPPVYQAQQSYGNATAAAQQGPDISRLHPLLQRQWDHAGNFHLGNIVVKPYSNIMARWRCAECPAGHPHKWSTMVSNRTVGVKNRAANGCPYCSGAAVCPHNSLASNDTSVMSQWSDKNRDRPENYTVGSGAKKVWCCAKCSQEWTATISSRTVKGNGCPHCCDLKRKVKKQRQPPIAESQHAMMYWDRQENNKAGLDPQKLTQGSGKYAHWICPACPRDQPHRWTTPVHHVCIDESGCPCCQGRQACICNSLQSLHPDIAAEWDHRRNRGTPANYSAKSNKKVWWYNSKRGSFQATIKHRTQDAARRAQLLGTRGKVAGAELA